MQKITIIIFIAVCSNFAIAASFNCSKASTYVEKSICSDKKLSDIDSALNKYYKSLLHNLKQQPNNKASKALISFQKSWLSYRNQCKTDNCIFDLYALQLSHLYINRNIGINGDYSNFSGYNTATWFKYILKSYGVKRGVKFKQAVKLLRKTGWHLQKSEYDRTSKDGIFCGTGLQAVCYATFTKSKKQFSIFVFNPDNTWLVDDMYDL
ncbi:MAG: DUF1311 domain-containing protein [Gammaproteobacteria bacterium]|nr:MAG: DUF1311 domain-containing protein [Gammaproteobacteria bacterium]